MKTLTWRTLGGKLLCSLLVGCALTPIAQAQVRLVRVVGDVGQYTLDGELGVTGEYHELSAGRHRLSVSGAYLTDLTIDFAVSATRLRILQHLLSERQTCDAIDLDLTFQLDSWAAEVVPDPQVANASMLVIQGPHVSLRAKPREVGCASACCGWDRQQNWPLKVSSIPVAANIYTDARYLGSTDLTLSLPYGENQDGGAQEVIIRAIHTGYIGCSYRLSALRKTGTRVVACALRRPASSP